MAKSKKIKLQKRSAASARLQKGLSLPAGAGGDGYLGFRDMADLKCKYFVRTGNLARLPFALRMLVLFLPNLSLPLSSTAAWRREFS